MRHYPYIMIIMSSLSLFIGVGCVTVNPSNVHVSGFISSPTPPAPTSPSASAREPAYAPALRKVIGQQEKVAKELQRRDWEELVDESNDWVKYSRALIGYADTSHNPPQFRRRADALLAATEAVRRAAARHDARACQRALDACNVPLDQLCREFPMVIDSGRPAPRQTARADRKSARIP